LSSNLSAHGRDKRLEVQFRPVHFCASLNLDVLRVAQSLHERTLATEECDARSLEFFLGLSPYDQAACLVKLLRPVHRANLAGAIRAPTTRSPGSTTRGASASRRTWASTARRRAASAGRSSSSGAGPGESRSRSPP